MPPPNDNFSVLCVRVLSGEGSPAERQQLARLLRRADRRARYEELRTCWQSCAEIDAPAFDAQTAYRRLNSRLATSDNVVAIDRLETVEPSPRRLHLLPWLAIAAAAVLAVGVSMWTNRPAETAPPARWIAQTAHTGETSVIRLADGTRVTLNGCSTLFYPTSFDGGRKARLVGEAFFEVAHDPAHPFVLTAGGLQTMVRGTKFDVRALPDDPQTTVSLVEGRVEVKPLTRPPQSGPVVLQPGQQYALSRASGTGRIAAFDTTVALDWMKGAMIFRDETLSSVAARLEHRFGVKVEIADPKIADKTINASFRHESLPEILQVVSFASDIRYEVRPDTAGGQLVELRAR